MPRPASLTFRSGFLAVDNSFTVSVTGSGAKDNRVTRAVQRFLPRLSLQTGIPIPPRFDGDHAKLRIIVEQRNSPSEQYSLEVTSEQARLSADGPIGVLRGLETLLQLTHQNIAPDPAGFSIPSVSLRDEPRFAWRGLELDVSRHFIPIPDVKRILDGLAAVKLNVFHWHLSDDQGFRVESRRFPRLQQFGSDGLFYSQAEIRDVIAYARDRGIRIVPEFDMPGHATSFLVGYPKLGARSGSFQIIRESTMHTDLIDPTQESTYRFLDGFIGEMAKLFPDEYFHIGGDEVDPKEWLDNPRIRSFMKKHRLADGKELQAYFNARLLKIVTKHHKRMIGWDEVLEPTLSKNVVIQSWRGQASLWQAAREGHDGILSAGYYLDLMYSAGNHYEVDPLKAPPSGPGHDSPMPSFTLTPDEQKEILGGEAAMWEEIATSENIDAKLWPRLAAIAERFWSPEPTTDAASMYKRLELVDHWLEWLGMNHRTNLERMRVRLASGQSSPELDLFASILEPVKGYKRYETPFGLSTPFNRLVDAIAPESDAARHFSEDVDSYLAGPRSDTARLRKRLVAWWENTEAVRPILSQNSLLREDLPVDDAVSTICQAGLDALSLLEKGAAPTPDWKSAASAAVTKAANPGADMLVQIAPDIRKLIEAASNSSTATH